jgi:hypothetical protein
MQQKDQRMIRFEYTVSDAKGYKHTHTLNKVKQARNKI